MALNDLTLSLTQGVRARAFEAEIEGLTTGLVEVLSDKGAPGFAVINGKVRHEALPYQPSAVVLREREPGKGYHDSRIIIAAADQGELQTQAEALIGDGRTLVRWWVDPVHEGGALRWYVRAEDDLGATYTEAVGGGTPTPTAPAQILDLTATPGDGEVSLAWTAPDDGGSAITDYAVQYKLSTEPTTWTTFADGTSATPGAVVTGLTNDSAYDFRAAPINAVGQGLWSDVVSATPEAGAVIPAAVVYNASAEQYEITNADAFPGATFAWADEDGSPIAGQTGPTLARADAPAGKYVRAVADGDPATASNWAICPLDLVVFEENFDAADGTSIKGYDGWDIYVDYQETPQSYAGFVMRGGVLRQELGNTGGFFANKILGAGSALAATIYNFRDPSGVTGAEQTERAIMIGWSPANRGNYVSVLCSGGAVNVYKKAAGVQTGLANVVPPITNSSSSVSAKVSNGRLRVFLDGAEIAASVAAGGWDVSDVPLGASAVGVRGFSQAANPAAPIRLMDRLVVEEIPAKSFNVASITTQEPDDTYPYGSVVVAGQCTSSITDFEWSLADSSGRVLDAWTAETVTSAGNFSFTVALSPASGGQVNAKLHLRPAGDEAMLTTHTIAHVPAFTAQQPMQLSLNLDGNGYFVNPVKEGLYVAQRQGGWRDVLPSLYETSDVDAQAVYIPLAHLAPDENGHPTQWLQAADGYLATDNWGIKWDSFDHWPSYQQGTYDVTFPPGLEWSLGGAGRMSRTAYNSTAGTATIVINDTTAGADWIFFTGYNGGKSTFPPSFFFHMTKQGSTETGEIHSAAIDQIKTMVSHGTGGDAGTYNGVLRFMNVLATNRGATAGFSMTGFVHTKSNANYIRCGQRISPAEMLEMCKRVGCHLWLNVSDRLANADKLALAQFFYDNMPAGMKLYLEPSNEMWNFSGSFMQTSDIYNRSVAEGNTHPQQYVKEFVLGVDTTIAPTWIGCEDGTLPVFESVFGADNPQLVPVIAWQAATTTAQVIADMLDEQSIYARPVKPVFAIGPYVTGDFGNYSDTTFLSKTDRDAIAGTGPTYATFLTKLFAAQADANLVTRTLWRTFWQNLGDYCQSKGLPRDAIMACTYEHNWQHIVENNTPTGIKTETLEAFVLALRDPRAGLAQNAQHDWMKETGGIFCLYTHQSKPTTSAIDGYGIWGSCDQIQYATTQEPAKSIAAWKTANGV